MESEAPYSELAREWVRTKSGVVTIKGFRAWLESKFPDKEINKSSLSAPLKKLVSAGNLKVKKPGIGRRPTQYLILQEPLRFGT